jgi:hypothetical protein
VYTPTNSRRREGGKEGERGEGRAVYAGVQVINGIAYRLWHSLLLTLLITPRRSASAYSFSSFVPRSFSASLQPFSQWKNSNILRMKKISIPEPGDVFSFRHFPSFFSGAIIGLAFFLHLKKERDCFEGRRR